MQNDALLFKRLRSGEREAFAVLLDRYGPRVQQLARRYAFNGADAEDLTQEIFVDLFKSVAGFRGESKLETWIYRVALNHCLRHRENKARELSRCGDSGCGPGCEAQEPVSRDVWSDPQRRAAQSELKNEVADALGHLSELHREIVILHEMHGLTYAQCAEILQIPVGTVKSRLSNAFSQLRRALGPYVLQSDGLQSDGLQTDGGVP